MFCTNCGAKNKDGAKFCVECGKEANPNNQISKQGNKNESESKLKRYSKLAVKILFILILIPVLISSAVGAYNWYQNLPSEVDELAGITLGMKPVDVTLVKGKPQDERIDGVLKYLYVDAYKSPKLYIKFADASGEAGVLTICSYEYYDDVFGLGEYDSLNSVLEKLGQPTARSINSEGTEQIITYAQYNAAFVISQNQVEAACVTAEDKFSFKEEY